MKIRYALSILATLLIFAESSNAAEILNIRNWTAPDHTRVVIDTSADPAYELEEKNNILIINFKGSSLHNSIPAELDLNKPGIKKIMFSSTTGNNVKIEFILDKYQKTQVFKLKKFQDKPDRIVVDIFLEQISQGETATEQISKVRPKRIIVIDPGHGGDDPGASGRFGTREKNIVLMVGREIRKAINNIPGYRAILTRDGDYYVSFDKRLQIAKDANANLFISVHADAARNRKAKGSSVYCLSTGGASNEAAKLLANNENLSDIIGGVPNGERNTESGQIILNMFQTNTINMSKTFASTLINQLDKVNSLKYKSVQEAPFRVLKLPDIPAVLIEMAYISNAEEESLLKSVNFQKKLALAVASSVTEYLTGTASIAQGNDAIPGDAKSSSKDDKPEQEPVASQVELPTKYYKVKKGDTLFSVARNFNTQAIVVAKLNNMKTKDPLHVGKKILVPLKNVGGTGTIEGNSVNEKIDSRAPKKTTRLYTIRKGDTLFSLARKNSTTVEEICRINHLKKSANLFLGQKIKLPKT
jgi:N-acetylmuramoyl-L-alanine amidase